MTRYIQLSVRAWTGMIWCQLCITLRQLLRGKVVHKLAVPSRTFMLFLLSAYTLAVSCTYLDDVEKRRFVRAMGAVRSMSDGEETVR
jgi:hypothetical protein